MKRKLEGTSFILGVIAALLAGNLLLGLTGNWVYAGFWEVDFEKLVYLDKSKATGERFFLNQRTGRVWACKFGPENSSCRKMARAKID